MLSLNILKSFRDVKKKKKKQKVSTLSDNKPDKKKSPNQFT